MKKLISSIIAGAMLMTSMPAMARDHRWGVDSNRHSPYYDGYREHHHRHRDHRDRGVSTGGAVAIGLGALIVGAMVANSQRREREQPRAYVESTPVWTTVQDCVDVRKLDYYGNVYYERYCK